MAKTKESLQCKYLSHEEGQAMVWDLTCILAFEGHDERFPGEQTIAQHIQMLVGQQVYCFSGGLWVNNKRPGQARMAAKAYQCGIRAGHRQATRTM